MDIDYFLKLMAEKNASDMFLTSGTISSRLLGLTETHTALNRCMVIATGNNITNAGVVGYSRQAAVRINATQMAKADGMSIEDAHAAGEAAIEQRGVIQAILKDGITLTGERLQNASIGQIAIAEQQHRLHAQPVRQVGL